MDKIRLIKETIAKMLEYMSLREEVSIEEHPQEGLLVNIQSEKAGFLIGQGGINLEAFQHLARLLVSKQAGEPVYFCLDINNYRQHRSRLLEGLAQNIAQQALSEKIAVTLQPMPARERRIIHLVLSSYPRIETESVGEEPERRIVVRSVSKK